MVPDGVQMSWAEPVPNPSNGQTHFVLEKMSRNDVPRAGLLLISDVSLEVGSQMPIQFELV